MIHNHISHSAFHPGWSQLDWEFIQINSKKVWAQDSPSPYPIGYSKGGWVVDTPFYLHGLLPVPSFISRGCVCAVFSLQSWGCLLSLTLCWPFYVSHLLALLVDDRTDDAKCYVKFAIDSLLLSLVEWSYLDTDMRKFESSQKDESRAWSADSSKAFRKRRAFYCHKDLCIYGQVRMVLLNFYWFWLVCL